MLSHPIFREPLEALAALRIIAALEIMLTNWRLGDQIRGTRLDEKVSQMMSYYLYIIYKLCVGL